MKELEQLVDTVIAEAQEKDITPSSIANAAYKKIDPNGEAPSPTKQATVLTLQQIARDRLRAIYEPEQSPQESLAHARALEAYGRRRGFID
jgi:hypothetical protein